jgi:hypothetical protein
MRMIGWNIMNSNFLAPEFHYNGMRVFVSPPIKYPKETLSTRVVVSEEFRQEINKWLVGMFGHKLQEVLPDGQVVRMGDMLTMNRHTYEVFRREIGKIA